MLISKLTENVDALLIDYITENNLDKTFQSACKLLHFTENALVRANNVILVALDIHQSVILLLLDISAAFGTVDHNILLDRIASRFGVTGSIFSRSRSSLSDRYQSVNIKGQRFSCRLILWGTPGFCLRPYITFCYTLLHLEISCGGITWVPTFM